MIEINKSPTKYVTDTGQAFNKMTIQGDGAIDKMIAGAKNLRGKVVRYCNLGTSVKGRELGNLQCFTLGDYFDQLLQIQNQLELDYGIETDFSDINIREIEINRTFKLKDNFENYHRVLQLIMTNLPSYLKNQMDWKTVKNDSVSYGTYYATSKQSNKSKRYILFKIYNKSKQTENLIVLTDSIMRIEIKIIGLDKIKKSLGTNKFAELNDQIINDYFNNQIQKMIVQPFKKWQKTRDKYLLNLMKDQRESDIRHWQTNVLRILQNTEIENKKPAILDVEELMSIIDELGLSSNRKCDVKRRFRQQAGRFETVFCNRDDEKMSEIVEKLTAEDTAMNTASLENDTGMNPTFGGIGKIA